MRALHWLLATVACSAASAAAADSTATAARVDALLEQIWHARGVTPVEITSDAEFLRRAALDLNGVIPRASEVRRFLVDEDRGKRERLIDQLLASPRYATHMAATWSRRILPDGVPPERAREARGLQKWLRARFAANLRYDNLAGGLLLATGGDQLGPALFYQTNDLAPEKLAASTARLFMGVTLDCAQCHDHPYTDWSQRDFWGLAAFFARVQAPTDRRMQMTTRLVDVNAGDVRLPETAEVIPPKYPQGDPAGEDDYANRRQQITIWLASRDNPYFARAGVNWAWQHMFGQPLVESVDDLRGQPREIEQLLEELSSAFVASGFDLRELLRTIALSSAYGLKSGPASEQASCFAQMLPKPLTPEQLYDSFAILAPTAVAPLDDPAREDFVRRMRLPPGDGVEYLGSTLQVLAMMNGSTTSALVDHDLSPLLSALIAPFMDDDAQVDALFLATVGRPADPEQRRQFTQMLDSTDDEQQRRRILSDILWALVNSTEFAFNR